MGAFAESLLGARNVLAEKESVTPIIFIESTVRQVTQSRSIYKFGGGWTHEKPRVGPDRYDDDPSLWFSDITAIRQELANIENANWEGSSRIKPNFVIWLWQPIHEALAEVDRWHMRTLQGTPPYPVTPAPGTVIASMRITSTALLTGTGKPIPDFIEDVRQIQINTEPLQLSSTLHHDLANPINQRQFPFGIPGTNTPMRMPRVGERIIDGVTYYWLSQVSLADLFLESMDGRSLDCVVDNPATRNQRTFIRSKGTDINSPLLKAEDKRFTNPFVRDDTRLRGTQSPLEDLIDAVEQYRDSEKPNRCGGDEGVEVDSEITEGERGSWPLELLDILRSSLP